MESTIKYAKKNKPRAAVILIDSGQIAMIERHRSGQLFYVFPGGGAEKEETLEEAARRETKEELGLDVRVLRRVAESTYFGRPHTYFLVERTGGEFGAGTGKELSRSAGSERGSVTPVWLKLADLEHLPVYPERMAHYVSRCAQSGWPEEVLFFDEQEV